MRVVGDFKIFFEIWENCEGGGAKNAVFLK